MKKSVFIFAIISVYFIGYMIGIAVGKHSAIHSARLVEVTDDGYYISYDGVRLDNGHYSSDEVHYYTWEE